MEFELTLHSASHLKIKKRRGLSTVVSSAILLTAVAMMGAGLVSWSQTNLVEKQISLESTFSKNVNKLNEGLIIEHVWFGNDPPKFINFTLTNIGNIGLNVTEIELRNATTSSSLVKYPITDGGIEISESYSVNQTYTWNATTAYEVRVTTGRDSIVVTKVLSP